MQEIYELIAHTAATGANDCHSGESGTGKELIARTIHPRAIVMNTRLSRLTVARFLESLSESEFFGHRKGAFTGADRDNQGFFATAHKGTLFLDEVGELSPTMQVKLLRALESGEYIPVGDHTPRHADVRIIAATNRNLAEQLRKGSDPERLFLSNRCGDDHLTSITGSPGGYPVADRYFLKHNDGKQRTTLPGKIADRCTSMTGPEIFVNCKTCCNGISQLDAWSSPALAPLSLSSKAILSARRLRKV